MARHHHRRRLLPIGPILILGFVGLLLLWLSVAVTAAGVFRSREPAMSLRMWPNDGYAMAMSGDRMIRGGVDARQRAAIRALSLDAWRSEPTSAQAVRLAAIMSNDEAQLRRGIAHARKLSRRDLGTNLFLIEDAVSKGDVAGALDQYDVALRASGLSAPQLLFPVLDGALRQPDLTGPIGGLLAKGSEWVAEFVDFSIASGENVGFLAQALAANPAAFGEMRPDSRRNLVAALIDRGHFAEAVSVYRRLAGRAPVFLGRLPFNEEGYGALDWSITAAGDYGAAPADGDALQIFSESAGSGTIARRLLRLEPGSYRLQAPATVTPGAGSGRAEWRLSCASADPTPLAQAPVAGNEGRRQMTGFRFEVRPRCAWQWLDLVALPMTSGGRFEAMIDSVTITRG